MIKEVFSKMDNEELFKECVVAIEGYLALRENLRNESIANDADAILGAGLVGSTYRMTRKLILERMESDLLSKEAVLEAIDELFNDISSYTLEENLVNMRSIRIATEKRETSLEADIKRRAPTPKE